MHFNYMHNNYTYIIQYHNYTYITSQLKCFTTLLFNKAKNALILKEIFTMVLFTVKCHGSLVHLSCSHIVPFNLLTMHSTHVIMLLACLVTCSNVKQP